MPGRGDLLRAGSAGRVEAVHPDQRRLLQEVACDLRAAPEWGGVFVCLARSAPGGIWYGARHPERAGESRPTARQGVFSVPSAGLAVSAAGPLPPRAWLVGGAGGACGGVLSCFSLPTNANFA